MSQGKSLAVKKKKLKGDCLLVCFLCKARRPTKISGFVSTSYVNPLLHPFPPHCVPHISLGIPHTSLTGLHSEVHRNNSTF